MIFLKNLNQRYVETYITCFARPLAQLGQNEFEASWGCPIPMMDIEILRGTEGISIIKGPYEYQQHSLLHLSFIKSIII